MIKKGDFGLIFWLHLILILLWYVSPFLISWYFILVIMLFSYVQGVLIGGCILTYNQFGWKDDNTFFGYYLEKVGITLKRKTLKIIFFWIEPAAIFLLSLIVQIGLNFKPIVV